MTTDNVYVGVMVHYTGKGRHCGLQEVVGKKLQSFYLTAQAQTANVWADSHTAANALSAANGQLESGHHYALAFINSYGANAVAIRAKHNDWNTKPGGMSGRTISHRKALLDFANHGRLPVFSASSPLTLETYDESTDTMVIVVGLYDMGLNYGGQVGLEDMQLAMKAVTDGAGLELLTAVTGDSMTVKDGYGTPLLRGTFITGTAPLRGQLRGTDIALQPQQVEIPPHCTLAGDYLNEIMIAEPPMQPNSVIQPYGSS